MAALLVGGRPAGACRAQAAGADAGAADTTVREALESAVAHLGRGAPRSALSALAIVERREPKNPWLAYLRARAFLLLGRPAAAVGQLDRAASLLIEAGAVDPALARAIEVTRRLARRRRIRIELRSGLAYDTNVTFLDEAASGPGLIAGEQDARYGARFSIDGALYDDGATFLTLGGSAARSNHFHVEAFDYTQYDGRLTLGRRVTDRWEAQWYLAYEFARLGGDAFGSFTRVGTQLAYHWAKRDSPVSPLTSRLFYQMELRDFLFATTPELDRDGLAQHVGLEQAFRIRPFRGVDWAWEASVTYRYGHFGTDGSEFDRLEHRFGMGVTIPLIHPTRPGAYLLFADKPLMLSLDARWEWDRYRHGSLTDAGGDRRRDLITGYSVVLSQTLIDDPRRGTLVIHGIVDYTDARSNVRLKDHTGPFSYEKAVYGLQLQWSW